MALERPPSREHVLEAVLRKHGRLHHYEKEDPRQSICGSERPGEGHDQRGEPVHEYDEGRDDFERIPRQCFGGFTETLRVIVHLGSVVWQTKYCKVNTAPLQGQSAPIDFVNE